jgi:hypothetical protein
LKALNTLAAGSQPPKNDAPAAAAEHGVEEQAWTVTGHWSLAGDDLVVPEQHATAVYLCSEDSVVIRQQNWPDDDSFVVVQRQNLCPLIQRLQHFEEGGE